MSLSILTELRPLLERCKPEIVLVYVFPVLHDLTERGIKKHLEENTERLQSLLAAREKLAAEGFRVDHKLFTGDPATEILNFANGYKPDLIAMTSHGRSGVRRWIRGSVAERLMHSSRFPLLVTTPKVDRLDEPIHFEKIVVPMDGSPFSEAILPIVEEIGRLYGSEIVLFHAAPIPVGHAEPYPTEVIPATTKEDIEKMLEPYRKRFEEGGLSARVVFEYGTPAETILDLVEKEQPGLVAMTTHGRSGVSRWIYGSVAEKVLRHVTAPLLLKRTSGFTHE
ncbi:MAG: universal stress protein [Deltaproteobacteria bacterium]|nr:MAG: universal stress protein [Deltaproteobacteria bacterium]